VAQHAFHAGRLVGATPVPREEPRTIPWSYGEDRITAMPLDPARLYVYWEVSDGAIERARVALGPGGHDAWLNVRVYDTSGRLFDGTNAHSYFDRGLARGDRQFFFDIGKPGSDAFVEIGLLSHEGFFVRIVRSGRVSFPRRDPVGWADPEWMTVRVHTGEVLEGERSARPAHGNGVPGEGHHEQRGHNGAAGHWFEGFEPVPLWRMHVPWDELVRSGVDLGERASWEEVLRDGWFEGRRAIIWDGPEVITSWEAGPFHYPVEVAEPVTDFIVGPRRSYQIDGRTHVVYGPWQVVIRGLGAHRTGQVLQRWEIHRAWVAHEGRGVRVAELSPRGGRAGASERMLGASEWMWLGGSERRLGGASEVHYLGASERRLIGASETLYQAASERLLRGASERRLLGASEVRLAGASERLGASERRLGGASEGAYPPPPRR
jgi:hypothetical protein